MRKFWPECLLVLLALLVFSCLAAAGPCQCAPGCNCGPECECFVLKDFKTTQAPAPNPAAPATIDIYVPSDAVVTLDGQATTGSGQHRRFVTPPLAQGSTYGYQVVASMGGWTCTYAVTFTAGGSATVQFPSYLFGGQPQQGTPSYLMYFGGGLMGGGCAGGNCGGGGRGFRR